MKLTTDFLVMRRKIKAVQLINNEQNEQSFAIKSNVKKHYQILVTWKSEEQSIVEVSEKTFCAFVKWTKKNNGEAKEEFLHHKK